MAPSSMQLAAGLVGAAEEGVRGAAEADALCLRRVDQGFSLGDGDAERLLGMDVLAGGDRPQPDLDVGVRYRQVDDDLDRRIGEQCLDAHRRHAELGGAGAAASALMSAIPRISRIGNDDTAFRYCELMLPAPIRPIPIGFTGRRLLLFRWLSQVGSRGSVSERSSVEGWGSTGHDLIPMTP